MQSLGTKPVEGGSQSTEFSATAEVEAAVPTNNRPNHQRRAGNQGVEDPRRRLGASKPYSDERTIWSAWRIEGRSPQNVP